MKFIVVLGVLALAIAADAGQSLNNPFYCYISDWIRPLTNMHSLFTSYEAHRRFNFTTVNPNVSTCTPTRFWMVGRYGGRFPHPAMFNNMLNFAQSTIRAEIVSNYEAGRTTLCRQDFEAIRDWAPPADFIIQNAGQTTEAGVIAMQNIARRYQQSFPGIFNETYSQSRYHFRHTNTERTNTSIRAFATGLFGEAGAQNVTYENVPDFDWFMRGFDFCPAFDAVIGGSLDERDAFVQGPEFEEVMDEVNRKLGFHGANSLSLARVLQIWDWCRYETSSGFELSNSETGGNSAWCAPFSMAHHLVLEYAEDLAHFYFSGYGFPDQRLLENINCGFVQDLLTHMQSENTTDQQVRVFLTYTQEVQTMLILLGTFRDTWPLHQHNFAQQTSRHWLTSLIAKHGSHLSVIRHDCADGDHDLVFLLNERPILVPGCNTQNGVCKLSTIVNRLQRFIGVNCATLFCSSD